MTAIFTESEYEIELSAVQGPAGAGLSAIPNNTLLGNTSGSTATPVARTASQMGLQPASANLDRLDGTVEEQRAALEIGSDSSNKLIDWNPQNTKSTQPYSGIVPTFTRASTGMYLDLDGLWKTASANAPRFHHEFSFGAVKSRGLLIEPARTNVLFPSAMNSWTINNLTVASAVSPDGTSNAWQVTESTDGSATFHRLFTSLSLAVGPAYTNSIFFKPVGRTWVRAVSVGPAIGQDVRFDLDASAIDLQYSPPGTVAKIEPFPNGWFRLSVTTPSVSTSDQIQWWVTGYGGGDYRGDGRVAGIFWAPQIEAGTEASSPILTTGAAVTRAADKCVFANVEVPESAMIVVQVSTTDTQKGSQFVALNNDTDNESINIGRSASGDFRVRVVSGGVATVDSTIAMTVEDNELLTAGVSFGASGALGAIKGNTTSTDVSYSFPQSITQLELGRNFLGCIASVSLYDDQSDGFTALTGSPVAIAPNNAAIGYSDYAVLQLDANSAQLSRNYSFGNYQFSAPAARIRFRSTYPEIHFRFRTNTPEGGSTNSVGTLLVNGQVATTKILPGSSGSEYQLVVKGSGNRLFEFLLPYSRHVDFLGLRAYGTGSISAPPSRPASKILVVGDSITQGFFASSSYFTWATQLGLLENKQVVNYGFGSSEAGDAQAIASLIAAHSPDVVICCTGYNDFGNQTALATYKTQIAAFRNTVRAALPSTKILLGGPWYTPNTNTITPAQYRTQVSEVVSEAGDPNTILVNTLGAATNDKDTFPDDVHPTNVGHFQIAQSLFSILTPPIPLTWNTTDATAQGFTLSDSNRVATPTNPGGWRSLRGATGKASGKWYCELRCTAGAVPNNVGFGLGNAAFNAGSFAGDSASSAMLGNVGNFASGMTFAGAGVWADIIPGNFAIGDTIQFAVDATLGRAWIGFNGTWLNGGNPVTNVGPSLTFSGLTVFPVLVSFNHTASWRLLGESFTYPAPYLFSSWSRD